MMRMCVQVVACLATLLSLMVLKTWTVSKGDVSCDLTLLPGFAQFVVTGVGYCPDSGSCPRLFRCVLGSAFPKHTQVTFVDLCPSMRSALCFK